MGYHLDCKKLAATEKAIKVLPDHPDLIQPIWIPFSQIEENGLTAGEAGNGKSGYIVVSDWIAKKLNLPED